MNAGPWQSTRDDDADIAPCAGDRCGADVVLDHDGICPHGWPHCPSCGPEGVCGACRTQASADMFADGGHYSEAADPLIDHTALASEATYEARTAMPGYDPATNSYRRPQ